MTETIKRDTRFQGASNPVRATAIPTTPANRVSIESGRQAISETALALTSGPYTGFIVHTAYKTTPGDGLGRRWEWDATSTTDGADYLGSDPVGRWVAITDTTTAGVVDLDGPSIETVIATAGSFAGQTKVCSTRWSDGTGDGCELIWLTSNATANGVDIYANFPGQGTWRRRKNGQAPFARSTDIRGNGVTDDTAALQATIDRLARIANLEPGLPNNGPTLRFGSADRVRITDTIVLDPAIHCADICLIGADSRATADYGSMIFWDRPGSADRPMFSISTRGVKLKGLFFSPNSGRTLLSAIDCSIRAGDAMTALKIHDCVIRPFGSGSTLEYGLTTDILGASAQNMEEFDLRDVHFSGNEAGILLSNGQPLNWALYKCSFECHPGVSVPTGRGIWVTQSSSSMVLFSPNFGLLSTGIAIDGAGLQLSIEGFFDSERTKRLIGRGDGSLTGNSHNAGGPITIGAGRAAANSYGVASVRPTIAAEEDTWIHAPFGNTNLTMIGTQFLSSAEALPRWKIRAKDASITAINCTFPNTNPFDVGPVDAPQPITRIGCLGRNSEPSGGANYLYDRMHSISGTASPDIVSVVVPDGVTSLSVAWGKVESFPPAVFPSVAAESGSPSAGSLLAAITAITTRGCIVTLNAATGVGATVRINLHIKPRLNTIGLLGESAFTGASTVRATASGGGLRNFKWVALLAHLNAVPSANEALVCCVNGTNGFVVYGSGNGTTGSVYCVRASGAGSSTSGTVALSSADVARTHLFFFTQDGGTLRAYAARAQIGSGVAHTPAAAAAGTRFFVGTNNSGTEPVLSDWTILGIAGSDTGTTPTQAEALAYFDAVLAARRLVIYPPTIPPSVLTEHLWQTDGGATVDDEIGSDDITLVSGTAPSTALVVPDFVWVT
jgi:hypothetical protein